MQLDYDLEPLWRSLGGGAVAAAALALLRVGLEYLFRHRDRSLDQADRRRTFQRDAEARLERILQDRVSDADRRVERAEQRYAALQERYVALCAEHNALAAQYRCLLEQARPRC